MRTSISKSRGFPTAAFVLQLTLVVALAAPRFAIANESTVTNDETVNPIEAENVDAKIDAKVEIEVDAKKVEPETIEAEEIEASPEAAASVDDPVVVARSAPSIDREAPPSALVDEVRRSSEIEAHRPAVIATSPDALLPPILRVKTACLYARALETLSDDEAARHAYERCIGLGSDQVAIWRGLGRTRLRSGDFEGAESALLSGYQVSLDREARSGPGDARDGLLVQRAATLRELGELQLLARRFADAHETLERAAEIAPDSARIANLMQRAELERDGLFRPAMREDYPLWIESGLERRRARVEGVLADAHAMLPTIAHEPLGQVARWALDTRGRRIGIAATLCLLGSMLVMRRLRGHGDLVVALDFPPELRGSFTVSIETKPGRHKPTSPQERGNPPTRRRLSSRTTHHMVNRETSFLRLRPGSYFVVVNGVLQDPENDEVLMDPFEERPIAVHNGETTRVEFDLQPREYPVDVRVLWDRQPAEDAAVTARGAPQSMRLTRAGKARLRLCRGQHTIVVGSGDRVAERKVDVQSFQPTSVVIDIAGSEGIVFKGCPPAVKPYLHGDLNAAARALTRDGHNEIANLLLARLQQDQGQIERAADYYHAAGHPLEAAELRASLSDFAGAALLFREANDSVRAAQMFRAAGEWIRAGEMYESIRDLDNAAECYRESGDTARWLDTLEKNGSFFEAAQIALDQSDRSRAIRLLQRVGINDLHYGEACELLADAFEHEGHADLAVQKLEQRIAAGGGSAKHYFRLADLLEHAADYERALEVFQQLREEDPTYPKVATRIETLRKKLSARELSDSANTAPNTATPTAFLSEKRYELLSELGRGGMGVVFRARDLRLDREVALKRLPENLRDHPKAIQLFLREAQACARLNHRNIVTIYDTDQEDGNFFITMELLNGYPLNVIRRNKGRIGVTDVARISMQVADGLHYAHSHNIVHRDIKTANLFFTTDKVVKIMDFGLAKMIEEVRRGTTVLGGTPYYMAPEQAAGEKVDHRADIYALGITLYELVTGTVPFNDGDVAYHHRHTAPPDPREKVPDLPTSMAELILHMLEKDPEHRCSSAAEVRQRLQLIADPI